MSYKIERKDTGKTEEIDDYENARMVHDLLIDAEIPCRFTEVEGQ